MIFVKNKSQSIFDSFFSLLKKGKDKIAPAENEDINQQLIIQLNKKKIPSPSQLKHLPKFLNKREKLQLLLALAILIVSSVGITWRFYIKNSIPAPKYGGVYSEGMIGVPSLVNPILATSDVDRDLTKLIFSGLMKQDENNQLIPDLAGGYTIDAEQTTYTFELRDDIRWHDDTPITANDVIFTINNIKNPEYKSPFKNSFNGVTVQAINDKTIQFKLEKPFTPFLSILTLGIIPEHLWYSIPAFGANLADLNIRPIGSGPYKFKSLTRESSGNIKSYVLEAYEDYYLDKAYIKELNFKFYPDFSTAVTALQNKNVDGLIYLPKEYKEVLKNTNIILHNLQFPQYTAIFFNPSKNDLLNNNSFREALALSVDKERILNEVLYGDGQIISTPILPGLLGYDSTIKAPEYNPEKSKEILDNLKFTIPEDGKFRTQSKDDESIEISIKLTTIDQTENVKIASIIQENWQNIGIKTELNIIAKDKIKKDIIETRDYEALIFGQVINTNSGPYPFWHSSQNKNPGLNLSVLANKDIDDYLDIIRSAKNEESEIEPLKKFQTKLLELNFAIFLYNPTYTYPTADKLKGMENLKFINLPADRFNNITSWYIKTKRIFSSDKD
ncbi:MAG: peptide ABC transporter substrate-binding protein [Patescibacteria group bacterium]